MSILVCGPRDFADFALLERALDRYLDSIQILINGGAPTGVDALARQWAAENTVHCATVPAFWKVHRIAAESLRNRAVMCLKPDMLLMFPGGGAEAEMAAKRYKIPALKVSRGSKK